MLCRESSTKAGSEPSRSILMAEKGWEWETLGLLLTEHQKTGHKSDYFYVQYHLKIYLDYLDFQKEIKICILGFFSGFRED